MKTALSLIMLMLPLLAAADVDSAPLRPEPVHYRVFVAVSGGAEAPHPELRSRLGGHEVQAGELRAGALLYTGASWHPWDLPAPRPAGVSGR